MKQFLDYITDTHLIEGTNRVFDIASANNDLSILIEQGLTALKTTEDDNVFRRLTEENKGLLESNLGDDAACFPMLIFAAAFPDLLKIYERRGIHESILAATLEEFDEKAAEFYGKYGRGGLNGPDWLSWHIRGHLFQIGRLQYIVNKGFYVDSDVLPADADALDIHVTARGRLNPQECQKSMNEALAFVAQHFPERNCKAFTLCSWLLDEQLKELLPPESNIIQFAGKFTLTTGEYETSPKVYNWIFGFDKQQEDYKLHIPKTSLQRGAHKLLDHRRWFHDRMGYIRI